MIVSRPLTVVLRTLQVLCQANSLSLIFAIERETERAVDPGIFVRYDCMDG